MKRMLFICLLVLGASALAMRWVRRPAQPRLDERAAPWALYGLLASLGAFLIHNQIEFAFFETGPLMLFAFLAGGALGVRGQFAAPRQWKAVGLLAGAAVIWIVAAAGLAVPVILAEALAQQGDAALRGSHFDAAAADYLAAYHQVPYDADYVFRAALADAYDPRRSPQTVQTLLSQAIAVDPAQVNYYLTRAQLEADRQMPAAMKQDFPKALELNPNEVSIHLQYADALMRMRQPAAAAEQDLLAMHYNDLLSPREPKRMNDGAIRGRYAQALMAMGRRKEAARQCRLALGENDALAPDDPRRLSAAQVAGLRRIIDAAP
jgi:tetratricopeptide (TPR) repeat protein